MSRTSLTVGLAYDTDLERARQVLLDSCRDAAGVQATPPPEAWVEELADSSINVAVRYWRPADIASRWRVRSAVAVSVKAALDRAGITVPFPQRLVAHGSGDRRAPGRLERIALAAAGRITSHVSAGSGSTTVPGRAVSTPPSSDSRR